MNSTGNSILKIYASSTDKVGSELLYEYLVLEAKRKGINGVTVYRGIMGYGSSHRIESARFWELTEKLPVVIEIIDEMEKLEDFYQHIENELLKVPKGCMVTIQNVEVKLRKPGISNK